MGAFLGAFSAKAALEGAADYRGKVGQSIAAASLILRDRPSYKQGFGFTTFDDEGVARRDLTLIDKGMLQGWFHNGAPARHYKISHTAHGAQGARGSLGTSSTQIMIDTGSASKHDFLSGQVFKIIGLKGLHSWTNAISGHFSLAAEGMVYDNGVVSQMVKDVTISGNFCELLRDIQAVGAKVEASSGRSFFSPVLRFGNVSVAGA